MQINLNGSTTNVVTTDSYSSNTYLSSHTISTFNNLTNGSEGQMLVWRNGYPQWVDMPSAFQQYLAIVEHEQRKTTWA